MAQQRFASGRWRQPPGKFDDSESHAKADAEIRQLVFTGITNGGNFALRTASTEAAGYQNGIEILENASPLLFDIFRIQINDIHLGARMDAGMLDGFDQRFVGLGQIHILADKSNLDLMQRMFQRDDFRSKVLRRNNISC